MNTVPTSPVLIHAPHQDLSKHNHHKEKKGVSWFVILGIPFTLAVLGGIGYGLYIIFTNDDDDDSPPGSPGSPGSPGGPPSSSNSNGSNPGVSTQGIAHSSIKNATIIVAVLYILYLISWAILALQSSNNEANPPVFITFLVTTFAVVFTNTALFHHLRTKPDIKKEIYNAGLGIGLITFFMGPIVTVFKLMNYFFWEHIMKEEGKSNANENKSSLWEYMTNRKGISKSEVYGTNNQNGGVQEEPFEY